MADNEKKDFHVSDVISVTTGWLVSYQGVSGVYEILNFLTDDNLSTHQLPRAMDEVDPVLRRRFPELFPDYPKMAGLMKELSTRLKDAKDGEDEHVCSRWVEEVRGHLTCPNTSPSRVERQKSNTKRSTLCKNSKKWPRGGLSYANDEKLDAARP